MCGICGFFGGGDSADIHVLGALNDALSHRGPDDSGLWVHDEKKVGLGHRRLSIIDLTPSGHQPMQSSSGRYHLVFNGEIYNFLELKAELEDAGYSFRGRSDTEVFLAAVEVWGLHQAIDRINGMFAAGLFDDQEQRFFLFRDRVGIKPLYYLWKGGTLWFSSEFTIPFARLSGGQICREALALYFRLNYIPAPFSIYEGIKKVEPGVIFSISMESAARQAFEGQTVYWRSTERINDILGEKKYDDLTMDEAVTALDDTVSKSVRQRMVSDVPIGSLLSGGIDSSYITAQMQRASDRPIKTFTIGFNENDCNEAAHAKAIAEHLGTDHSELIVTESDALKLIPKMTEVYGEPFADSSQIPTYLVSKLARQSVTVALSGDGGDELFGGYDHYITLAKFQKYVSTIPSSVYFRMAMAFKNPWIQKRVRNALGAQRYELLFNALRLFCGERELQIPSGIHSEHSLPESLVRDISPGASLLPFRRCNGSLSEQAMANDFMVNLPDDLLVKVDRASMAVSLEIRVPFLDDVNVFDLAWRIPRHLKFNGHSGKLVLKKALADHIPSALFERPKMGFGIPLAQWLGGQLHEWVADSVDPVRIRRDGLLDASIMSDIVAATQQNDAWYAYKLWAICMFQSWFDDFHRSVVNGLK